MRIVKRAAARIAREASLTGKSVRELILRDKVLTEDQLNRILTPTR
jgi:aspartate ammonia-lyase